MVSSGVEALEAIKSVRKLFRVGRERDAAWEAEVAAEALRLAETVRRAVAVDRTTEGSPVYGNLPNLQPLDASRIGTARFKHYRAQSEEWNQRVAMAGKEGRAEGRRAAHSRMRNAAIARRSLATYEIGVRRDLGSYYNGINVVTLTGLLEHAARENKRIPKTEISGLEDLKTIVNLAATAKPRGRI